MTETHATLQPNAPVFPPGRYGRRRTPGRRRPVSTALLVLAVVAMLSVVSVRLYQQYGDPAYDAQVISYGDITDSQVVVDFRVNLPDGGSAVCVLRARDHAGAEVAREEVPVTGTAGQRHVTVQHRLATSARPFIGEVVRCRPTP
ncbi:protein of unknown function [Micromonospora phaseoli]|uniref:DUF4307 domain-containing protein n=1 Tax=Micromonospora phaseoli TaxID=1144548 RepID=A0A1H6ZYX4_9ACTN|nr:DUF4307 domain-containing protein [Micromonospora phaseoli]PZV96992.1 uncharacterized protein DUF4307 [Micromonospora phaseoli]GIJ77969.1 hypothetical protein Xph01_24010 [Micromonospora phaseoli]SEJ57394.1 protein of unknown function [Micromonospora phaseoli]